MSKTVTVTTMVVVGEQMQSFTASGETEGSVHRLARALTRAVADDVSDWSNGEEVEADKRQRQAKRAASL